MAKWRFQDDLADLKPVDKTRWGMSPTVNAYYNPSYNEIVFPAASPPFTTTSR
jgi:putative endopeptidase